MPRRNLVPLDLTDEGLDRLSQIDPTRDTIEARQWWQRNAPRRYRNLLDAEPITPLDEEDTDEQQG